MLELINDLVDVTRLDAGKSRLNRETLDLGIHLGLAWSVYEPSGRAKGLVMRMNLPESLPPLFADHRSLATIFGNLLSNAVKYSSPGNTVTLSASASPLEVKIVVADTGQGIEPGDLARVFEKMSRLAPQATGGESGTGLGLAITRRLVELHGGSIRAESMRGKGSTFTVTLPLS